MKKKLLTIIFIGLLVFSTFGSALASVKCPTCKGAGTIKCPTCNGTGEVTVANGTICTVCSGTGVVSAKFTQVTASPNFDDTSDPANPIVILEGQYLNQENIPLNATITGSYLAQSKSTTQTFQPGNQTLVKITIPFSDPNGNPYDPAQAKIKITYVDSVICSACNGTGYNPITEVCPDCNGGGTVVCPDCGGTGILTEDTTIGGGGINISTSTLEAIVVGIAVAAGIGVTAFFVVKKKGVNEKSLRKLSSSEFQKWVIKRLDGKSPSSSEASMGIDGFTLSGQAVSIKQAEGVGMSNVDSFAYALGKSKAKKGVIVAFSFGDDAVRGRVRARMNYGLDIQMITVRELMDAHFRA